MQTHFRQKANPFSTKCKPIFDEVFDEVFDKMQTQFRQNAKPFSTKCKNPHVFVTTFFDFWPRNFRRNVFCRILLGTFVALLLSPLVGHIWWLLAVGAGVGVCCWLQVLGTFGGLFFCWVLMLAAAGCRWWLLAAGVGVCNWLPLSGWSLQPTYPEPNLLGPFIAFVGKYIHPCRCVQVCVYALCFTCMHLMYLSIHAHSSYV